MNEENIVKARRGPDGQLEQILADGSARPLVGKTDWARLDAMTEEEIHQNALDDPDNPPLTPERLAKMRRVPNPKNLRLKLGLTQKEFSRQFEIALGTLRDWEQGVRRPDSTAKAYLRIIAADPTAVQKALAEGKQARTVSVLWNRPFSPTAIHSSSVSEFVEVEALSPRVRTNNHDEASTAFAKLEVEILSSAA